MEDETNPETPEVEDARENETATEVESETEAEGEDLDAEDEGQTEDSDLAEIELDGETFKVPEKLKDKFLMHRDYTQKTQEVAELRRNLADQIEAIGKISEQELETRATLKAYDAALEQYASVDWNVLVQTDPQEAQRAQIQYMLLQQERGKIADQAEYARQQRDLMSQQERAKRYQEIDAELSKEIPGWSKEKATELLSFAQQHGFSPKELADFDDVRAFKILNLAIQGAKLNSQQKTAKKFQQQATIKPAAKVTGGKTPVRGLDDRASTDAWMRERQSQLSKR